MGETTMPQGARTPLVTDWEVVLCKRCSRQISRIPHLRRKELNDDVGRDIVRHDFCDPCWDIAIEIEI